MTLHQQKYPNNTALPITLPSQYPLGVSLQLNSYWHLIQYGFAFWDRVDFSPSVLSPASVVVLSASHHLTAETTEMSQMALSTEGATAPPTILSTEAAEAAEITAPSPSSWAARIMSAVVGVFFFLTVFAFLFAADTERTQRTQIALHSAHMHSTTLSTHARYYTQHTHTRHCTWKNRVCGQWRLGSTSRCTQEISRGERTEVSAQQR